MIKDNDWPLQYSLSCIILKGVIKKHCNSSIKLLEPQDTCMLYTEEGVYYNTEINLCDIILNKTIQSQLMNIY